MSEIIRSVVLGVASFDVDGASLAVGRLRQNRLGVSHVGFAVGAHESMSRGVGRGFAGGRIVTAASAFNYGVVIHREIRPNHALDPTRASVTGRRKGSGCRWIFGRVGHCGVLRKEHGPRHRLVHTDAVQL